MFSLLRSFFLISLVLFTINVHAKRVMVFFKEKTYYQKIQNVLSQSHSHKQVLTLPLGAGIQATQVVKSLENIDSVIIDQLNDIEIKALEKNKEILFVDTEVKHPLPFPVNQFAKVALTTTAKMLPLLSQVPWGIVAVKAPEAWNISNGGEGARVLILDTGVDRDHPSLRPNLELGKDFVGDNQDGYPYKDTVGHGTHVAGTIAGVLDSTGFSGVAPKAKFLAGRVCAEDGCSNFAVAEGINWGLAKKVDVISMSLGGERATPSERLAISKATAAGITVVAASGNNGTGTVSFPAALPECIAVGAVNSQLKKADFSQYGPELAVVAPGVDVISSVPLGKGRASNVSIKIGEAAIETVKSVTFEGGKLVLSAESNVLVDAGLGREQDFASLNVAGKVALIQRGEIKFIEKVNNAIQAKAMGVIIYNNTEGLIQGSLSANGGELPVGVFMIEQKVGEKIREALAQGVQVQTQYQILITNYDSFNGTSMATPHVSGVVALMKAANKNLSPKEVKKILRETATSLGPTQNNELGSGLVNAKLAVEAAAMGASN